MVIRYDDEMWSLRPQARYEYQLGVGVVNKSDTFRFQWIVSVQYIIHAFLSEINSSAPKDCKKLTLKGFGF